AMDGGGDAQGLEHRPDRELAGVPIEVVDAVLAGVEAVHHDVLAGADLEAPRLGVVAARRPTRLVENRARRGEIAHGAAARVVQPRNWRRAMARATRRRGLR